MRIGEERKGTKRTGMERITLHHSEKKKMKKYEVEIKGMNQLIFNVPKKELWDELKKVKKNELNEWEEDNWHRKANFDEKGNVVIPSSWFRMALIDACKKTKIVPHFATRKNETYTYYMKSFIVNTISKPLCKVNQLKPYGAFVGATGLNSSTKVWRIRPMVEKWSGTFELIDPAGRMTMKELKNIIEYAGLFGGLGDNRCNNFGRFEVIKIKDKE